MLFKKTGSLFKSFFANSRDDQWQPLTYDLDINRGLHRQSMLLEGLFMVIKTLASLLHTPLSKAIQIQYLVQSIWFHHIFSFFSRFLAHTFVKQIFSFLLHPTQFLACTYFSHYFNNFGFKQFQELCIGHHLHCWIWYFQLLKTVHADFSREHRRLQVQSPRLTSQDKIYF